MSFSPLFERQWGVAAYDQLLAQGLDRRRLAWLVAAGALAREGYWLYCDPTWTGHEQEPWRREVFKAWCGLSPSQRPGSVAFRRTAAYWWRMDGAAPTAVELLLSSGRASAGRTYLARQVAPHDRVWVDGLPITSVRRTLLDLGQVESGENLERALEWALRTGHTTVPALRSALAEVKGHAGTAQLRRVIERRPNGAPATESDAETLFLQLARGAKLPDPARQYPLATSTGNYRLDFAWPEKSIAVEIDGAAVHATRQALATDLRRQNSIVLTLAPAGWHLLRFSWEDVALEKYRAGARRRLVEAWMLNP